MKRMRTTFYLFIAVKIALQRFCDISSDILPSPVSQMRLKLNKRMRKSMAQLFNMTEVQHLKK